jgi:cell division topological specificity factor
MMNPLIGGRTASAPVAQERLQILLAHERGLRGQPDLLGVLRAEILAVVSCLIWKRSSSGRTGARMSRHLKSILRCLTVSRGQLRSLLHAGSDIPKQEVSFERTVVRRRPLKSLH